MATHSSVLAWRIPGTEEPRGLPSLGLQSRTRLKQCNKGALAILIKGIGPDLAKGQEHA